MSLRKRDLANRRNGLKGGVKTAAGKAISRLNARRHSIFVSALTPEDAKELYVIEDELIEALKPVGRVEEILVEKLALTYLRMQRCSRAEGEYHVRTWEKPGPTDEAYWEFRRQRGLRAVPFSTEKFKDMVELIGLYDTRLGNQFLRFLHEIERQQRLRKGENVPPPVVGDIAIHADAGTPDEEDAAPQKEGSIPPPDVQLPGPAVPGEPQQAQDTAGQEDSAQKAI